MTTFFAGSSAEGAITITYKDYFAFLSDSKDIHISQEESDALWIGFIDLISDKLNEEE